MVEDPFGLALSTIAKSLPRGGALLRGEWRILGPLLALGPVAPVERRRGHRSTSLWPCWYLLDDAVLHAEIALPVDALDAQALRRALCSAGRD